MSQRITGETRETFEVPKELGLQVFRILHSKSSSDEQRKVATEFLEAHRQLSLLSDADNRLHVQAQDRARQCIAALIDMLSAKD
jgi:hypothetical protein